MQISSLLVIALSAFGITASVHERQTPPPDGETYITARPACNITGFTEVPGNYTEIIYQPVNATLVECIESCRANGTWCKSVAYASLYTECLWYNMYGNEIQLWADSESEFNHFDEDCDICEYVEEE